MRHRPKAVPLPFSDEDADESLQASRDYFWMLQSRILEENTRASWRSFRAGYANMAAFYREDESNTPGAPPPKRGLRGVA